MPPMNVRKAIFPAAGLGTRFLPATKASPKEMLPLVDKPLIQYAVEEAVASGLEDIIVVTGRRKRAIEDHFDRSVELEENLKGDGKGQLLSQIRHISNLANFCYVRQSEALGLGHAVLCAQHLIGDEPFAVMLGDEIIDAPVPSLAQLIHTYKKRRGAVLGIQEVPHQDVNRYGIVSPDRISDGLYKVADLVEKPAPSDAPSNLAVIGRYVLPPEIFPILRKTKPGKNGEIQLTDALRELAKASPMYALEVKGNRYDAGDKLGFLIATVEFALKNPSLGADFAEYLRSRTESSGEHRRTSKPPPHTQANPSFFLEKIPPGAKEDRKKNRRRKSIKKARPPPQNVEIPEQLPLLPVRDIVVFPYMVLPLFVGREMSIKAIEAALAGNRMIFLATQKALDVENPTPDDIHVIATVGIIMRMLKLPDERTKILVQGLSKAKIADYIQTDPYYSVRIDKITEAKASGSTLETEAVMRTVKEQIERIVTLGKVLIPDVMVVIENLEEPGRLADMVASNLGLKVEVTQSVLEIMDPIKRLRQVSEILAKEIDVLSMQQKIQAQAKGEMDKTQREYFLREQLKAIQKELGDLD